MLISGMQLASYAVGGRYVCSSYLGLVRKLVDYSGCVEVEADTRSKTRAAKLAS